MYETAICSTELAPGAEGGVPDWVRLMPLGELTTRPTDGRPAWRLDDPAAVVAATRALGVEPVVDYEHQTDLATRNGQPAPAAGWVKEVEARADGIWGRIEWTAKARAHLQAKEYRYLSPSFHFDKATRVVKRILRAALTNDPALYMTALARSQSPSGDIMKTFIEKLREELGLAADTAEDAVLAHAKSLKAAADAATGTMTAVAKAAGLGETDPAKLAERVATALATARAAGEPDPAKYAPIETVNKLAQEVATLKASDLEKSATAKVEGAVKAGKLLPAQRDWALGYAKSDPAAFDTFVEASPVLLKPGPGTEAPPRTMGGDLSEEELAVARSMGVSEVEFKKVRDEETAR